MTTECSTCTATELRIVVSIEPLSGRKVCKTDVVSARLQTEAAAHAVYVPLLTESTYMSSSFRLIKLAVYRLTNGHAKWQV